MNQLGTVKKMAAAVTPYRVDFGPYLASLQTPTSTSAGDALTLQSAVAPIVAAGVVATVLRGAASIVVQSNDSRYAYFQLSGGVVDEVGQVQLTIATVNGNTDTFMLAYQVQ